MMANQGKRASPYQEDSAATIPSKRRGARMKPSHALPVGGKEATPAKYHHDDPTRPRQTEPLSVQVLEQKKMLLPYLDKIEYINIQLRQRGLLQDNDADVKGDAITMSAGTKSAVNLRHVDSRASPSRNQETTAVIVPAPKNADWDYDLASSDHADRPFARVSADILRLRYPRLAVAVMDGNVSAWASPRLRPINWLLRLIEDVYDELTGAFLVGASPASDDNQDGKLRLFRANNRADASGVRGTRPRRLVMPFLVRKYIEHTLGRVSLADQECVDLMYNIEATIEHFPQVATFSQFLREIYDEDALLFFLFLRYIVQQEFDLQLKTKEKLAHTSVTSAAKKYIPGNMMIVVDHPLIPDGTKRVLLSTTACEEALRKLFSRAIEFQRLTESPTLVQREASAGVLAHFTADQQIKRELFTVNACHEGIGSCIPVEIFLAWSISAFCQVSEDIVARFKFNDDGESLSSLIRLRDTITSDAKIEKLMALHTEEERKLRLLKIELLRVERGNTGDKHRTQLRLLQNRVDLQEKELQHIKNKIDVAETVVGDVWKEVVGTSRNSSTHSISDAAVAVANSGLLGSVAQDLPNVLGRFYCHISRLHRKYEIEVRATAMLTKPWKQQMEELRVRMIIRIQRAYRARKKSRNVKEKAKEELHEKIRDRELQRQRQEMERKRQEALHERDIKRHNNRMAARKEKEERIRKELERKQQVIVGCARNEEIAHREHHRNQQYLEKTFGQWVGAVNLAQRKRRASRLFLKFQFIRWRIHSRTFQRFDRAARVIQQAVKRKNDLINVKKIINLKAKRSKIAKRYMHKIQMRNVQRVFNKWSEFAADQIRLKETFQIILQRRVGHWFERWRTFVALWKRTVLDAVLLVQRVYRGRLARRLFHFQRMRVTSVRLIQRMYRGWKGRKWTLRLQQVRTHQARHCSAIVRRVNRRYLTRCLNVLNRNARCKRTIRISQARQRSRLKRAVFFSLKQYAQHKRDVRAEFLRRQYVGALVIQRNYRRHRCQAVFRLSLASHRAAIKIQSLFRGYEGRLKVAELRQQVNAARNLQAIWRRRQAIQLAEKTKVDSILLAAYKGDFTSTQRSISNGYGYVVDSEGDGILHMAAAAGRKRIIKLCLRSDMDINAVNKHYQTPLHLLLANLPAPGFGDSQDVIKERVALASYMIDHGAWHECTDEHYLTPLLLCAATGQVEATEMLLERGANADARSASGMNAIQLAVEGNHSSTLSMLLTTHVFNNPSNASDTLQLLHTCAGRGLIDCLRMLTAHLGVFAIVPDQFDCRDREGYTPLIYAISNGHADAVRCLLECGASPDEKDFFGRSPLHFAVSVGSTGSASIVELLVMYDVDVNIRDNDGDSPLHVCCDSDARLECAALLLRNGVAITSNALGNHPTHIAARNDAVETLKILIDYGADMNIKNYADKTPLGVARMHNQTSTVQFISQYFSQEETEEEDAAPQASQNNASCDAGTSTTLDINEADRRHGSETTTADWRRVMEQAYQLGTLAEWVHYVHTSTECSFFFSPGHNDEGQPKWTWETPVEFMAALSDKWEVIRGGGVNIASRDRTSPHTDGDEIRSSISDSEEGNADRVEYQPRGGKGIEYFYHNVNTGEIRTSPPPIDYTILQDVVQNTKRNKMLRQRIRKVSADTSASAMEYMRFFRQFEDESAQGRAELRAVIQIQRHFRARRTRKLVKCLLFENRTVVQLQRMFRGRQARSLATRKRKEHAKATVIQALWRGHDARRYEREVHHSTRVMHLHRRRAALMIQSLFRGYKARRLCYRAKVVSKLGPRGYFEWEKARRRAITIQSFKIWDEMELPHEFPRIYFYCHRVTMSCSWEKPKEWLAYDCQQLEERCELARWGYTQAMKTSAVRLQVAWRARQARIAFRIVTRSVQLMKSSELEYLEDPTNLVKMGNYVLFLHAIQHDYDRARPLYGRLARMMAQRGPDVPFILFSYGIFLYVTQEDDVALVEDMILRGHLKDRQLTKYKMAFLGYFRQSVLQNPEDAESNLNYAACLQWLYAQYEEATTYYLRAIAANPHKPGTMELFQDMLDRKKQADRAANPSMFQKPPPAKRSLQTKEMADELRSRYDGYELFRRWQVQQAEEADRRRRMMYEAEKQANDRVRSARLIQARYRRRRAKRMVNRMKLERQLALAKAEMAQQRATHDHVQHAFERVAQSTSARITKPMSLPIGRLDDLFRAMNKALGRDARRRAMAAFRTQYPKVPNMNVMDMTSFILAHPELHLIEALKE